MRSNWKQAVAVAVTIIIALGLYLLPIKGPKKEQPAGISKKPDFSSILENVKAGLSSEDRAKLLDAEKGKGAETAKFLGSFWDSLGRPDISSHYFEEIAKDKPGEKTWLDAAYRYFDAWKMPGEMPGKAGMVDKAIESYKKVLEHNPDNLDAKSDLGVIYAEGTNQPMTGIMMLREVVTKNPRHENAHLNLGLLSVKSNQLDKAIERFNKVIEINPSNDRARLLLANTYMQKGDNENAIKTLTELKKITKNKELAEEAEKQISRIKSDTEIKK